MANPFTKHPKDIGESYIGHLFEALYLFVRLTYTGLVMPIHALLPFLFTKTASNTIFYFHERFSKRFAQIEERKNQQESEVPAIEEA